MITVGTVQAAVAAGYGVTVAELNSDARAKRLLHARHVAMFLSRRLTGRSYPQIGRRFGDRDHSTVIHACRRIEAQIATDADLGVEVDLLAAALCAGEEPKP